eukprot:GFUD01088944.1.p1 GENE.GFUD01088944.1~~GFUD01088944.1.p1  ORF type:complete len:145 (+),score=39.20 GFUD01088944.1:68-502(+)
MSDFEDKAGRVAHPTEWGNWSQTVQDVTIKVFLEKGTRGKEVNVKITPSGIECSVRGKEIFQGIFCQKVAADDSTWTIEDQKLLRIFLCKSGGGNVEFWPSLFDGQFQPDSPTIQKMRQKLDLERYQLEHPGFDFSGAKLDKTY